MRVAIVGYGLEGQESARYWQALGADITVCDANEKLELIDKSISSNLGDNYLKKLDEFDLIVRTAGLHPRLIIEANLPDIEAKITSSVNEFFRVCPTKNIIGVTGTKGKGTTSTLIAKMLEAGGKTVHLGGNIGVPALELLPKVKADDWVVLELSSFQLLDIKYSPHIAVCLMVVPEHLDWHKHLDGYISAKANLFKYQKSGDIAIYNTNSENSLKIASVSAGAKQPYDVPKPEKLAIDTKFAHINNGSIFYGGTFVCKTNEVKLLGWHNLENICAAINAVWDILGGNTNVLKKVISSFSGLEHRIEFVREFKGVKYYNDSFATTPETSIACMEAFGNTPKVMILGGSDKGIPFDDLVKKVVGSNVRYAVIIGDTAGVIATKLQKDNFNNFVLGKTTMDEIVATASDIAEPGDVVLLSTGCASFGLFKDYKDRGLKFKQVVNNLS